MNLVRRVFLVTSIFSIASCLEAQTPKVEWNSLPMERSKEVQRALPIGLKASTESLHLALALPCGDAAGLQAFADSVSDPKSPNYRRFITPDEVGRRFGLDPAAIKRVSDYLESQGMTVRLVAKNRLSILADATVGEAESAFHTTIHEFIAADASPGADATRFSFDAAPSVPASIKPFVSYVEGLADFDRPKPAFTLTPDQLRTLYAIQPNYLTGYQGQGRTIGISSFTEYGLQNIPLEYAQFNLPTPPGGVGSNIKVVPINGSNGNVTSGAPGEADADMQCVLAMAPLCNLIIYDDAKAGGSGYLATLTQETNDNLADIITESYGRAGETTAFWASIHSLHLSMTSQGMTYMCASGDTGTQWVVNFPYPDVEPEVLTVGGTSVTVDSAGNRETEVTWNNTNTGAAGGGGWAVTKDAFNVLPPYQKGTGVPTNISYRLVPDLAIDSDGRCGYQLFRNGVFLWGEGIAVGGTSCACPTLAAILADCEQQIIAGGGLPPDSLGYRRFGRIQDLLYSYNGDPTVFFDVVSGTNGTLPNAQASNAGPGWDTATGWGAFIAAGFVNRVLGVPELVKFSLSPATVVGGFSAVGTVTLSAVAPAGGTAVNLSSNNSAVTVPPTVTVAAGSTTANFTIASSAVSTNSTVTISAMLGGVTLTSGLSVTTGSLAGLNVVPSSVLGGTTATGTVNLNGGASAGGTVVNLSSNSSAATVPASVTVPAGAVTATFTIQTSAVSSSTVASISASLGSISKSSSLTIQAAALTALTLNPTSLTGGSTSTGTVMLSGPAGPSGDLVTLSAGGFGVTMPPTVTVPAGATSATFQISTSSVAAIVSSTISATMGSVIQSATLIILPPALSSLMLNPSTVVGGSSSVGTVTLNGPAAAGGVSVTLSTSNGDLMLPTSVTIPAGSKAANFSMSTLAVPNTLAITVTATEGGVSKTATLTLGPLSLISLTVNPSSVTGGNSSTGAVTLNGPAGPNGATVTLSLSSKASVTIPSTVTIGAGQVSTTFAIQTSVVAAQASVSITATLGSGSQTATLTLNPATLFSLILNPNILSGGSSSTGTVTLTGVAPKGGFVVKFASGNPAAAPPTSVSIAAGKTSATFVVKTVVVKSKVVDVISASLGTTSLTATLTVNPPVLQSLALKPASVIGLTSSTGTVTLSGPAPTGGMIVGLSSSQSAAIVPTSITVPAGRSSVTFTVKTISVAAITTGSIGTSLNGASVSAALTINPPLLTGLSLSPASVVGGKNSTGTVTLGTAAPSGGLSINLASSVSSATLPRTVTVPAGKTSAQFNVTTSAVGSQVSASITASLGASSKSAKLTIQK